MAPERRYDEGEAREIFAIAAHEDSAAATPGSGVGGFTLAELQEIGGEAGIHPDRVAEAAGVVAARGTPLPEERSLGMEVSVGQLVPLPRRPTEAEWDTLVSELRDIFAAPGEVRAQGGAREWSNGALRVFLERTAEGHQLRLTTVNRRFQSLNRLGAMLAVSGLVLIAGLGPIFLADGVTLSELLGALLPSLLVAGAGVGLVAFSALSLPKWVRERREQFERIGDRARGLLAGPPATGYDPLNDLGLPPQGAS
jgi:hypothetical protein